MSLVATRLDKLRAENNADKNENRPSRYGLLNLFMTQTESPVSIVTEDMKQKAMNSWSGLTLPVINGDDSVSISNTANVTIADTDNTSKLVDVTFKRYAFEFTIDPAIHLNNSISVQRDFNAKMLSRIVKLGKTIEEDLATILEAQKTQVLANKLHYDFAGNTLSALWKDRMSVLGDMNSIMNANDYFGQLDIVGNAGIQSLLGSLQELGLYNKENKFGQYGDKRIHLSERVENADGDKYGTGYAVEDGNLGLLFRVERDAQLFTKGSNHQWGQTILPILGIPCATYYYNTAVDASSKEGDLTRTLREHFGFSVDIATITSYNSKPSAKASPIIKFEVKRESDDDAIKVKSIS